MKSEKVIMRDKIRRYYDQMDLSVFYSSNLQITERILNHPLFIQCERIFLYVSVGHEINTCPLIEKAYRLGKTVALPKCESKGIMHFYKYTGELCEGKFRIPEPVSNEILVPLRDDLMIVPGLCFDTAGNRLGQGGGYYDRFLEKYRCITVGLCREQMLEKNIPVEWNDLPVDFVITESSVYECKNGASNEAPL